MVDYTSSAADNITQDQFRTMAAQASVFNKSIDDYVLIKNIGKGSYGQVFLAQEKSTEEKISMMQSEYPLIMEDEEKKVEKKTTGDKFWAIKQVSKYHIIKYDKSESVQREKDILYQLKYEPFVISLDTTFQDKQNLYFVFEHCPNGSLSSLIKQTNRFTEKDAQHYIAQILAALESIYRQNIKHRDIKPENIMLDDSFNVKIIDFGDANYIVKSAAAVGEEDLPQSSQQTSQKNKDFEEFLNNDPHFKHRGTFVGTPLYVAPEMLKENESSANTDLWALGCIMFQMLCGRVPFQAKTDFETFTLIQSGKYTYPSDVQISQAAKDLISQFLSMDPQQRGADNYQALKSHPFFKGLNFSNLIKSQKVFKTLKKADSWVDLGAQDDTTSDTQIYHTGDLKKRNEHNMNQLRTFVLFKDGRIHYYKDKILYRGQITLTKDTQIVLSNRKPTPKQFKQGISPMQVAGDAPRYLEIHTPTRTYYLSSPGSSILQSAGEAIVQEWALKLKFIINQL